jgi:hypothetical protein
VTTGEDLSLELHVLDKGSKVSGPGCQLLLVVLDDLLRLKHILEHGFNLVDSVVAALNLQLVDHQLLCLARHRGLVQQPLSQKVGKRRDEEITTVEAAEETDDGIQPLVYLVICELLETFSEFIVAIEGNVVRSLRTVIHKVLKAEISGFLEPHIIIESFLDKVVDSALELEDLDRELEGIFQVLLITDYLATLL